MWDPLQSKDRAIGVRFPSRANPISKKGDTNLGKSAEIPLGYSDQQKGSHPYGLEVARYTSSEGAMTRDNSQPYLKPGSTYSFTQNDEASPYRRVSSFQPSGSGSPTTAYHGSPPKLGVRTASDAAHLPNPLVWTRSPLRYGSRRVSTENVASPEAPSVDCKCPEIYYSKGSRGTQPKSTSPDTTAKKKYVFSPRDSSDVTDTSEPQMSSTTAKRVAPQNIKPKDSATSLSLGQAPSANRRTTLLNADNVVYAVPTKLVHRNTDTFNGGNPGNVIVMHPPSTITTKRLSLDKSSTRRASNPPVHYAHDSSPSTVSSSLSEIQEYNRISSSAATDSVRHPPGWHSGVKVSDPNQSNKFPESQVKHFVSKKLPPRVSTLEHKGDGGYAESKISHSPTHTVESTISSFSELEEAPFRSTRSAPLQYSFISTRVILASFVHRWKSKYEENKNAYFEGGYLKVTRGSLINNRYAVIQKLGWGEFSTVWLGYDTRYYAYKRSARESFVALKIARCKKYVTENTAYEINLLRYLCSRLPECPMTKLLDSFSIMGEYGSHLCMVMTLHGANLLSIIDQMKASKRHRTNEEIRMVKEIIASTLVGLHHLSMINVIHTDIKPENIIATSPDPKIVQMMQSFSQHNSKSPNRRVVSVEEVTECMTEGDPNHLVCLADFGLSTSLDTMECVEQCRDPNIKPLMGRVVGCKKNFSVVTPGIMHNKSGTLIQTREYRAPEVILGMDFNCQTDVWSVGCTVFELLTGRYLMDPKKKSFNERQMDVQHLASMMQLIGSIPNEIAALRARYASFYEAREKGIEVPVPNGAPIYLDRFIDVNGKFIYADRYRHYEKRRLDVELEAFLPSKEAKLAASFILTSLYSFDPKKRPTAKEMLQHPWLQEVHSFLVLYDISRIVLEANRVEQMQPSTRNNDVSRI